MIKVGLGYDLHTLVPNRKLMLGGIEIPFDLGEDGHSDGDVLLHAISDALIGASGLGDIGSFFPPSDQKWKDADSKELLRIIWNKVTENGWSLENIDAVIAIEKPKFLPHRQNVINSIANILDVNPNQIFVIVTTYTS
jgi:2-C-methyl-D-erythritol 2,4-cyclodiphosphate synthase